MTDQLFEKATNDEKLFSSLLGEVKCLKETLEILEGESVSIDEAIGLIGGIQRDIVQMYRAAQ